MVSKSNESGSDVPKVGETIIIGGNNNGGTSPSDNAGDTNQDNKGNGDGVADTILAARPRRRKSIGARTKYLESKLADGSATDDERAEYERTKASRARRDAAGDSPPRGAAEDGKEGQGQNVNKDWRKKYGDANGRERICVLFAGYWDALCQNLSDYIVENGGRPLINLQPDEDGDLSPAQKEWAGLLILAVDDILPPNVQATPAIIAVAGTSSLMVQGAVTAYRKKNRANPTAKPIQRTEEERARAARNANTTRPDPMPSVEPMPPPDPIAPNFKTAPIEPEKTVNPNPPKGKFKADAL